MKRILKSDENKFHAVQWAIFTKLPRFRQSAAPRQNLSPRAYNRFKGGSGDLDRYLRPHIQKVTQIELENSISYSALRYDG